MAMSSAQSHHKKDDVATNRPGYREARWERAVKVYTVNQESKYLLVQNVHALGVTEELLQLCSLYGTIHEYRLLDEYPSEPYTDVYWIKFTEIDAARVAKKRLDNHSFFGKNLHVCYAPEFESVQDTREKLQQRRKVIAAKTRDTKPLLKEKSITQPNSSLKPQTTDSVGDKNTVTEATCSTTSILTVSSSLLQPTTTLSSTQPNVSIPPLMSLLPAPYPSMWTERECLSQHTLNTATDDKNDGKLSSNTTRVKGMGFASSMELGAKKGLSTNDRVSIYLSSLSDTLGQQPGDIPSIRTKDTKSSASGHQHSQTKINHPATVKKRRRI